VNNGSIYVVHSAVVSELTPVPISSFIATTNITRAVVDSAIKADVRTPISVVPAISTTTERPIRRRPKRANIGGNHPYARYPIIAGGSISPVTGRP
jgi:hypothetical protein